MIRPQHADLPIVGQRPAAVYAADRRARLTLVSQPTPQIVTPEQRRAAKATRKAQRDARKRARKAGRK
jgi:hypothetical protein